MKKSAAVTPRVTLQRSLLSMAVAAATFGMAPAHAVQFEFMDGEVTGSFDTTLSYGALWRVTGQDPRLVGAGNGGERDSSNFDNGNQNYRRGEQVSSIFRMSNELGLNYKNFGAFFRVASFYDHEIQNKDFDPNRADKRVIRNRLGHDYEILDAFVSGSFNMLDRNVNVRVGKQVISLGESTFIPNGLNALNPVDVAKLRTPGAELKDALLPTQMLSVAFDITDNLSVELINKFQFRATRLEPNGSYFSTNDFLSPGGTHVLLGGSATADDNQSARVERGEDINAKHSGQYAIALRWLVPELNNTEFGLYHINVHSTTPGVGARTAPSDLANGNPLAAGANLVRSQYFAIFPEDIAITGLSFNTLGPLGIAFQGEYSYRKNQPINLVANNTLLALGLFNKGPAAQNLNNGIDREFVENEIVEGFKRVSMHQAQFTATGLTTGKLANLIGADQIVTVFEGGYTYLNLPKGVDFGGPGFDLTTPGLSSPATGNPPTFEPIGEANTSGFSPAESSKGLLTKSSYGYRVALRAPYNSAFGAVNLIPRVAYQHDLRGTSPTFVQGTKSATIGLTAEYQNTWNLDVSYTNFFGGETIGVGRSNVAMANPTGTPVRSTNQQLGDRDFIAATVSYAF